MDGYMFFSEGKMDGMVLDGAEKTSAWFKDHADEVIDMEQER